MGVVALVLDPEVAPGLDDSAAEGQGIPKAAQDRRMGRFELSKAHCSGEGLGGCGPGDIGYGAREGRGLSAVCLPDLVAGPHTKVDAGREQLGEVDLAVGR